ncbi:MAG: magnesium and cobalt transport protein CorA [Acidimicrobiales bacterium]|nr:magnesium and cobalt transport protein CorA [Acidimicrobiales bacterium]
MIVDCAAYVAGHRAASPSGSELRRWADDPDALVWLGLRMPSEHELGWVCAALDLDLDADEARAPHDRPVLTRLEHAWWLVLRTARYEDSSERLRLGELSVLFGAHFVVTIRYGHATPLDGLRRELEADQERLADGAHAVLTAIIEQVVEDYDRALDGFEGDVLEAEQDVFDVGRRPPVRRLYFLKRQRLQLLVVTEGLQEPLRRIARRLEPAAADDMASCLDRLDRVGRRTRTLSDLVTTAIDVNFTQVSLQQNEDMRRISAWVAIAAVPTMMAGIYGMNFDHMPELHWSYGYPLALIAMATICFALHRVFRRSGWL